MGESYPDVMTIQETSQYLRIPISSLYKLAQEGKIPCQKVGRHWRFHRETLNNWIAGNSIINLSKPSGAKESSDLNISL